MMVPKFGGIAIEKTTKIIIRDLSNMYLLEKTEYRRRGGKIVSEFEDDVIINSSLEQTTDLNEWVIWLHSIILSVKKFLKHI